MSNPPGAHRELTQEPSPPPLPCRIASATSYTRVFESVAKPVALVRGTITVPRERPSISIGSLSHVSQNRPSRSRLSRSTRVRDTQARVQHSIRELLTLRTSMLFEKWTGSASWLKCKAASSPTVPESRPTLHPWRYNSFPVTDWVAGLLTSASMNYRARGTFDRDEYCYPFAYTALLDAILALYNLPYHRKGNRIFPNLRD